MRLWMFINTATVGISQFILKLYYFSVNAEAAIKMYLSIVASVRDML